MPKRIYPALHSNASVNVACLFQWVLIIHNFVLGIYMCVVPKFVTYLQQICVLWYTCRDMNNMIGS